jgi:hypothetical protein
VRRSALAAATAKGSSVTRVIIAQVEVEILVIRCSVFWWTRMLRRSRSR